MPQARKSARSTSRASAAYKEPAAIKRLNTSLDGAQKALKDLQAQAGRNAAVSTRALHKGIGKFLSDARRDAGKFGTALKRDFDAAQKAAKKAGAGAAGGRATARKTASRASRATKSTTARATKPARKTATKAAAKPRARASTSRSTRKSS
jgi:hypothetical protein